MTIKWKDEGNNSLWLVTPEEFLRLPDGITLESIMGDFKVKGRDEIDQDTRGGHIAWGIRDPLNHEYKNELLLIFIAQGTT